jgi:hypothetical protein
MLLLLIKCLIIIEVFFQFSGFDEGGKVVFGDGKDFVFAGLRSR